MCVEASASASTVWVRPRDRKSKVGGTKAGKGRHGEGMEGEEAPGRQLHLEAADPVVENVFDDRFELEDASWDRGVDRGVEALELPAPRRRRRPCEQV